MRMSETRSGSSLKISPRGLAVPDPSCAPLGWVVGAAVRLPSPYVLVNSFASGGANYSVVVRIA